MRCNRVDRKRSHLRHSSVRGLGSLRYHVIDSGPGWATRLGHFSMLTAQHQRHELSDENSQQRG